MMMCTRNSDLLEDPHVNDCHMAHGSMAADVSEHICVMPCARIVRVCQLSASSRSSASRAAGPGAADITRAWRDPRPQASDDGREIVKK